MRQLFTGVILAASFTAATVITSAQAQEIPLPAGSLKGFDGIIAECIVQTPDAFATGICKMLFAAAAKQADRAGVKLVQAGSQVWEDVKVEDRVHLEPPAGSDLASPVRLTFFVRGAHTNSITGGYTRIALWTPAEIQGRSGKLVLWETATMGTGPRNGLRAALVKTVVGKLETPFTALVADNKAE